MTASPPCPTGKHKYRDEETANTVLGRIWATCKPGRRLESRYYQCPHCGFYHLTSKPPRENGSAA